MNKEGRVKKIMIKRKRKSNKNYDQGRKKTKILKSNNFRNGVNHYNDINALKMKLMTKLKCVRLWMKRGFVRSNNIFIKISHQVLGRK